MRRTALLRRYPRRVRSGALVLIGILVGVAGYAAVSDGVFGSGPSRSETVRIAALKSESGAVRVALQQQGAGGAWGDRQHPHFNTVGATARTGVWLNSSPLELSIPAATMAAEPIERPLYCVIAHGHATDPFWSQVRGFLYQSAGHLGAHVQFHSSPDGAAQAAAIDRCRERGASAIASTLADPEAVTEALLEAKASGARIVTFNSGADLAQAAGSELHIALNDPEAGRLIGRELNAQGLTGVVGCLIHEERNVGLGERCDGLAETYLGGSVVRVQLPAADDRPAVVSAIAGRLSASDADQIDIVVTLSGGTSVLVLEVIAEIEAQTGDVVTDKRLVAVGYSEERGALRRARARAGKPLLDVLAISDAPEVQGYFIVSALMYVGNHPLPPAFVDQPAIMLITPWNLDVPGVFQLSRAEQLAASQAYRAVVEQGLHAQADANER